MPCYDPKPALNLPSLRSHPNPPQYVNCSRCHGCKREKARQWNIRLQHEAQLHETGSVEAITLTYADEHLPEGNSLRYSDVQEWLKRLRYHAGPFRYFLCGEYGESGTRRPHYHVITFGFRIPDRYPWLRSAASVQCRSDMLERTWGHGHILCDEKGATDHAMAYTAGYVQKKVYGKEWSDEFDMWVNERTGEITQEARVPPFTKCSLRPSIAFRWISRHWREVYSTDTVALGGREYRPPMYYDRFMKTDHEGKCGSHCPDHMATFYEVERKRWDERPELEGETLKRRRQKGKAVALKMAQYEQRKFDA